MAEKTKCHGTFFAPNCHQIVVKKQITANQYSFMSWHRLRMRLLDVSAVVSAENQLKSSSNTFSTVNDVRMSRKTRANRVWCWKKILKFPIFNDNDTLRRVALTWISNEEPIQFGVICKEIKWPMFALLHSREVSLASWQWGYLKMWYFWFNERNHNSKMKKSWLEFVVRISCLEFVLNIVIVATFFVVAHPELEPYNWTLSIRKKNP